jgi:hypothetical protein
MAVCQTECYRCLALLGGTPPRKLLQSAVQSSAVMINHQGGRVGSACAAA